MTSTVSALAVQSGSEHDVAKVSAAVPRPAADDPGTVGPLLLRAMTLSDMAYVVTEHQSSLPDGADVRLGAKFLQRYHAAYVTSPGAVSLIGELNGHPVGFVSGVVAPAAHTAAMKRALPGLATASVQAFLSHPVMLRHVLRTRATGYVRRGVRVLRPRATPVPSRPPTGIITYLAVSASARGNGIGEALVRSFLSRAHATGCAKVTLATQPHPFGAERFYLKQGWVKEALHETTLGAPMQIMSWTWPR